MNMSLFLFIYSSLILKKCKKIRLVLNPRETVTPRFPNNVNNTNNQSIQRKTECHTTKQV